MSVIRPLQVRIGLPGTGPGTPGLTTMARVHAMYSELRRRILDERQAAPAAPAAAAIAAAAPPTRRSSPATFLTFEPAPYFKIPRAYVEGPSEKMHRHVLERDLRVRNRRAGGAQADPGDAARDRVLTPELMLCDNKERCRYLGPGQLMLVAVLDIESPALAHVWRRDLDKMLGEAATHALTTQYGLPAPKAKYSPGLWLDSPRFGEPRQIAQLGNNGCRDGILACHVAVNLDMPVAGGPDVSPWARMADVVQPVRVDVTSVAAELGRDAAEPAHYSTARVDEALQGLGAAVARQVGLKAPEIVGPEAVFGEDWEALGQEGEKYPSSSWWVDVLTWAGLSALIDI